MSTQSKSQKCHTTQVSPAQRQTHDTNLTPQSPDFLHYFHCQIILYYLKQSIFHEANKSNPDCIICQHFQIWHTIYRSLSTSRYLCRNKYLQEFTLSSVSRKSLVSSPPKLEYHIAISPGIHAVRLSFRYLTSPPRVHMALQWLTELRYTAWDGMRNSLGRLDLGQT